jgi:hypothetical protein
MGMLVACAAIILATGLSAGVAHAEAVNCDANAIIPGGAANVSTLQKLYTNGASCTSGGATYSAKNYSIQDVYHAFGMAPADITAMSSDAVNGYVTKSGDVYVGSTLVATGAYTAGRQNIAGSTQHKYGATTYYQRPTSVSFQDSQLSAMVIMKNGVFAHAILHSCGNPVNATPVPPKKTTPPTYSCVQLVGTPADNSTVTYSFTVTAAEAGGATFSDASFNFGDGKTQSGVKPTGTNKVTVSHTYTSSGTYKPFAVLHFGVSGKDVTAPSCGTSVSPSIPYYQCVELTGATINQAKMDFSFTANAKFGGGATFTSADFNFGDGTSQKGVKPASGSTSVTVQHAYSSTGNYDASAVLHFNAAGAAVTAAACAAKVTPTSPPTPECKPGVPVGSPACSPCLTDSSLPANSPQCQTPPPQLPNTGAGNVIAIFGAVVVAGFLVYRQLIFRRHHAAFVAAEQGTSPLPLDDPLNEIPQPVVAQPRPWRRHSLRRKRPY